MEQQGSFSTFNCCDIINYFQYEVPDNLTLQCITWNVYVNTEHSCSSHQTL